MSRSRSPMRVSFQQLFILQSTITEPDIMLTNKNGCADKVKILVRIRPLHANEEWNENLKIKDVTLFSNLPQGTNY